MYSESYEHNTVNYYNFSAKLLIYAVHAWIIVTWQLVTWLYSAHLHSLSAGQESFAEFALECVKISLNNCVLHHLLVPELVIKGQEGLNLANFKEALIGTVNVTSFVQTLVSSCGQFVVHGQGASKQMSLV